MTDVYDQGTNPFQFVDSISGTAATGKVKNLVPIAVNRQYHRKVQTKLAFAKNGLIGPDTFTEGNATQTAAGYPVIRKTDLSDSPGDSIRVGVLNNLSAAVSTGKVGNAQLVNAEAGLDFDDLVVKIMQWRQGVRTTGGAMDSQRNPFKPLAEIEMEVLSDWYAQIEDTSILYGLHYGWSPNLLREHGTTSCPPTATANLLFGNDLDTTRTIADLVATANADNVSAQTFELSQVYCEQNNFDPVSINGEPYWVALISPMAAFILSQDDRFHNAMLYARERGLTNPLFKNAEFVYANHIIFKYDKMRSVLAGYKPASLTVAGPPGAITEVSYTGIGGGITAAQLHQTMILGANAVALAEGQLKMAERIRAENDYQTIIGRAADGIFGTRRFDMRNPADTVTTNQSLLQIVNTVLQ